MEERITELEIRYSYQHRQLEELSQVLYEKGRLIDRLTARLAQAEQRIAELLEAVGPAPVQERPPHY